MRIDNEIISDTVVKMSVWESFPTSHQSWHQHNPTISCQVHRCVADAEQHKPPWLVSGWFRTGWSFAVGSTCHDATSDHWKIYSKQVLYIQRRNGYMNQCSIESRVNRFTVFGGVLAASVLRAIPPWVTSTWHVGIYCVFFPATLIKRCLTLIITIR